MLYKYRSLREFKNFVDIILNHRLYAAPYFDLNDPMEGHYLYNTGRKPDGKLIRAIKGEKEKLRICSLSEVSDHPLMWAHYADGHHGIVIGVNIDKLLYDIHSVKYTGLFSFTEEVSLNSRTAKEILCHKYSVWNYEKEKRVFVFGENYVQVEIKQIILGSRMSTQDIGFVRNLVDKILPEVSVIKSRTTLTY